MNTAKRSSILKKGLLLIGVSTVFQLLFVAVAAKRQGDINEREKWALHTKDVIQQIGILQRELIDVRANVRDWMISKNDRYLKDYKDSSEELKRVVTEISRFVSDNPTQETRAKEIESRIPPYVASLERMRLTGDEERLSRETQVEQMLSDLKARAQVVGEEEERLNDQRIQALDTERNRQDVLIWSGAIGSVVLAIVLVWMFSRNFSGRLSVVMANTRRLGTDQALYDPVGGNDEISDLDVVFHDVADQLKSARLKEQEYRQQLERRTEELARLNNDLSLKNQENETFVYSVSHDLRSPLVNLQGFSKELSMTVDDLKGTLSSVEMAAPPRKKIDRMLNVDMAESIQFINAGVMRLANIIDALLRLSRAGRVEFNFKNIDMNPILRRIVDSYNDELKTRGVEVQLHDLPAAWSDAGAAEQIFGNMVGNAIKYLDPARPGKIEIGIVPASAQEGNSTVRKYYVRDNGLGISAAHLPKLFVAFQRLHPNVAKGEGIGLALSKRTAQRLGGDITVESKAGEGSTFFVLLPASKP